MRVVGNRFVCTEKEMNDLKLVDRIFRQTCFAHFCGNCPFWTKRKACTASRFLNNFMHRTSLEETEEEK